MVCARKAIWRSDMEPMGSASSCQTCDVYHPGRSLGDYGASRVRDIHLVIEMLIQRFHPSAQDYVYLNDKVMHFFGFMLVHTGRIQGSVRLSYSYGRQLIYAIACGR